jgi:DNA-binding GntR family transcriptional regulator
MTPDIERTPPYQQIADAIARQISTGQLKPGDKLPPQREMAREWGVTQVTVTRAISALKSQGLVEVRSTTGAFVAQRDRPARLARHVFDKTRAGAALFADGETWVVTHADLTTAPPEVAEALGLEEDQKAIRRRRVISDASGPIEVSTTWRLAEFAEIAPALLSTAPFNLPMGALEYIEEQTGRLSSRCRETISARDADAEEAESLGIKEGDSVLVIQQTVLDTRSEPLEILIAVLRPDQRLYEDVPIDR